jgi:hypothetical protein
VLWLSTLALATYGPKFIWGFNIPISISAIIITGVCGGFMIRSQVRQIRAMYGLQQKIQTEAMAFGLGIGIVGGLCYSLLDLANVIQQDAEIGFLVMIMSVGYMIALSVGKNKYK